MWVYTVTKDEKTGLWYAHKKGYPYLPVFGTFERTKKRALKHAADCMGMTFEQYMEFRNGKGV